MNLTASIRALNLAMKFSYAADDDAYIQIAVQQLQMFVLLDLEYLDGDALAGHEILPPC